MEYNFSTNEITRGTIRLEKKDVSQVNASNTLVPYFKVVGKSKKMRPIELSMGGKKESSKMWPIELNQRDDLIKFNIFESHFGKMIRVQRWPTNKNGIEYNNLKHFNANTTTDFFIAENKGIQRLHVHIDTMMVLIHKLEDLEPKMALPTYSICFGLGFVDPLAIKS